MQKTDRTINYSFHSPQNKPQFTVQPDEIFLAETELCTGGWLNSIDDIWTPDKTCGLNPTVVVAVEGAQPGDLLAVDIINIAPDTIGYTGFNAASNPLANTICLTDWGHNLKTVRIENGFVYWNDKIVLPISPMIGTLGTAPAVETLSNAKGGRHGGNMDVQEVCAGTTVYLPVEVPGALLHIGDVHAIQGDGEINCSGGIECRSRVRMRTRLVKRPDYMECVRAEDKNYIMTIACERTLEESFYLATEQLLQWMCNDYGYKLPDAYLLMGQVLEARNTQFVNPTRSYICKMPKKYL